MNRFVVAVTVVTVSIAAAVTAFVLRSGGEQASSAGPVPAASAPVGSRPACRPADILSVLTRAMNREADGYRIVSAQVIRCRKGYAQVTAVPDESGCGAGGPCLEHEQVFLGWTGKSWRIVTAGTGISCGYETDADIRRVCGALGYPEPMFQTPSRNIGCLLMGGTDLRCDIRSGLVPAPADECDQDWVGVLLPAGEPAEPLCGGDTAYDDSAPTLAYGETWHRGPFKCESRETGLRCTNDAGLGFTLAREGWKAS